MTPTLKKDKANSERFCLGIPPCLEAPAQTNPLTKSANRPMNPALTLSPKSPLTKAVRRLVNPAFSHKSPLTKAVRRQ